MSFSTNDLYPASISTNPVVIHAAYSHKYSSAQWKFSCLATLLQSKLERAILWKPRVHDSDAQIPTLMLYNSNINLIVLYLICYYNVQWSNRIEYLNFLPILFQVPAFLSCISAFLGVLLLRIGMKENLHHVKILLSWLKMYTFCLLSKSLTLKNTEP